MDERYDLVTVVTSTQEDCDDEGGGLYQVFNRNLNTNEWFCYINQIVYRASFEEI
jgi:hypothetical protein